ncbi:MAG: 3-methyladenine DNA glycosylase [Halarcobacter sp.]
MCDSYDLLKYLKNLNLLEGASKYWWPADNDFEVLIGAILTQNTKWTNVEKSLENLKKSNLLDIEKLSNIQIDIFIEAITPSGFKNQKANRIKQLCKNILQEFNDFENFKENVSKEWLLEQKGIGDETADAIMCYACHKEFMVVDKYTAKLLKHFSYEFKNYRDLQSWCEYGINKNYDKIVKLYGFEIPLNMLYCRFHGKIVQFMKSHKL